MLDAVVTPAQGRHHLVLPDALQQEVVVPCQLQVVSSPCRVSFRAVPAELRNDLQAASSHLRLASMEITGRSSPSQFVLQRGLTSDLDQLHDCEYAQDGVRANVWCGKEPSRRSKRVRSTSMQLHRPVARSACEVVTSSCHRRLPDTDVSCVFTVLSRLRSTARASAMRLRLPRKALMT